MHDEKAYLKYLIDEEIYIIDENRSLSDSDTGLQENPELKSEPAHKNKVILLLDYENREAIPENHEKFIVKILQSVRFDSKSTDWIFSQQMQTLSPQSFEKCRILAFMKEVPGNLLPIMGAEKYALASHKGNKILLCDPIGKLYENVSLKRKLWDQLKTMFAVS